MANGAAWTDAEDALIRANIGLKDDALSDLLTATGRARSPRALSNRRVALGLAKTFPQHSDEVLATIHRMLVIEGKPPSEIARTIGLSRGAVASVADRKGWKWNRPVRAPKPPKPVQSARAFRFGDGPSSTGRPILPAPVRQIGPVAASRNLLFSDPGFSGCMWPTGEYADQTLFCAAPIGKGPYCPEHGPAAHQHRQMRPPAAVKDTRLSDAPKREDEEPTAVDQAFAA